MLKKVFLYNLNFFLENLNIFHFIKIKGFRRKIITIIRKLINKI